MKMSWSSSGMILTRGTRKYREINLSHCHFSDHKFHWPGVEHGSRRWEVDNEPPEPLWPHLKAAIYVLYVWRYVGTSQKTRPFSSTYGSPVISYKEVIDVYPNNHVDYTHASCGQNTEFLNVTSNGTSNDLWALKGKYRNVISDCIDIFAINTFPISAVSDVICNCSVVNSCDMATWVGK
jgi:hypothetical protein